MYALKSNILAFVFHFIPFFFFQISRFPSGVQTRTALCLKTLSLMALIFLRIGREMVQRHMADTLRRFFAVFSLLDSLQPQVCVTTNTQRFSQCF